MATGKKRKQECANCRDHVPRWSFNISVNDVHKHFKVVRTLHAESGRDAWGDHRDWCKQVVQCPRCRRYYLFDWAADYEVVGISYAGSMTPLTRKELNQLLGT